MGSFSVQGVEFDLGHLDRAGTDDLVVASSPRDYVVHFLPDNPAAGDAVVEALSLEHRPILVADQRVLDLHFRDSLAHVEHLGLEATEELKSIDGAVRVLDFLVEQKAAKDAMVFAVGGGIIQDVVGFSAGVLKRGTPWTYVPTTLLSQADSCIGSKTGINFKKTKNLLGLFSAPRQVLVHAGFVATLEMTDVLSGLGEIFKLCITGGEECLASFESLVDRALDRDGEVLGRLAALALSVKRPVIEADELDTDLRRALNFGHSIGHALESATDYAVPHGIAVTLGALIESELSRRRGRLDDAVFERLLADGVALLPPDIAARIVKVEPDVWLDLLGRDKKVEGTVLKLAVPVALGRTEFIDFELTPESTAELGDAIATVVARL